MHAAKLLPLAFVLAMSPLAIAGDEAPQQLRQDLMKDVREAAKPVGNMLRGNDAFDADTVMASLEVFSKAAAKYGDLFPEGSESGYETEAAPAIWEDRAGFDEALGAFAEATSLAIESAPQSLEEARETVSPVFKTCKGCHDSYRIED